MSGSRPRPTIRLKRLGAELRRLREQAGLSGEQAASLLEISESKVSRVETGRVATHPREVRDFLDVYGVDDQETRDSLFTLARHGRRKGWWQRYEHLLEESHLDFISLEADAETIKTYEPQLVPGLLQSQAYVRSLIEAAPLRMTPAQVDELLEIRKARQEVLSREKALQYWAVLDEAILRRMVGGPQTMLDQLRHLLDVARLQSVTLQVLPFASGAPAWSYSPYAILEFPAPADLSVVYLENLTSCLYLEEDPDVRRYSLMFDHMRASALSPKESAALVERAAADLERSIHGEERSG